VRDTVAQRVACPLRGKRIKNSRGIGMDRERLLEPASGRL
jgi:hypothetical protein